MEIGVISKLSRNYATCPVNVAQLVCVDHYMLDCSLEAGVGVRDGNSRHNVEFVAVNLKSQMYSFLRDCYLGLSRHCDVHDVGGGLPLVLRTSQLNFQLEVAFVCPYKW